MEVITTKNELELWTEEAYDKLLARLQDELTEEERVIFLWNAHVLLNNVISRR